MGRNFYAFCLPCCSLPLKGNFRSRVFIWVPETHGFLPMPGHWSSSSHKEQGKCPLCTVGLQRQTWDGLHQRSQPPAAPTSSEAPSFVPFYHKPNVPFFFPVFSLMIWHKSLLIPSYHVLCLLHLFTPLCSLHLLFPSVHLSCFSRVSASSALLVLQVVKRWHILGLAPSMSLFWALPRTQAGTGSTTAAAEHLCIPVLNPRPVAYLCQGLSSRADSSLQTWKQPWDHLPDMRYVCCLGALLPFQIVGLSFMLCFILWKNIHFSLLDIFLISL